MNNEKKAPVLTLEHLAPYLPYKLKLLYADGSIRELLYLDVSGIIPVFKPILHPLSDLTKEIEHKGERFVPIEWFEIGDDESENWFEFDHGNIKLINDISSISTHGIYHDINFLPYAVVQKLTEWHFDVFSLIDKGLAIDINSIQEIKGGRK